MRDENSRLRPWRPGVLGAALAASLILLLTLVSYAGRHATWQATEFQVLNLDNVPADLTARFYDPGGAEVFSFTHRLSPGHTEYYRPEEMGLASDFVGMLHVETEGQIAGAVMHVATSTIPSFDGNDVFSMYSDSITNTRYLIPYVRRPSPAGESAFIYFLITNVGPGDAQVTITFYNQTGTVAWFFDTVIPSFGSITHFPDYLDETFVGSGVVLADRPIRVDILEISDSGWAVYAAPTGGSTQLYAPLVPARQSGAVTPTISVRNLSATDAALVTVCSIDNRTCQESNLDLTGSTRVEITSGAGPYTISSNRPIAAVVGAEGVGGSLSYAAGGEEQIGYHLAAPMLFEDYHGFTTRLWVYNTGKLTATVTLAYVGTEAGAHLGFSASIGPDQVQDFGPALGQPHYAALVSADQPILGLVEGFSIVGREDGRFAYWATPFVPPPPLLVYLPLVTR